MNKHHRPQKHPVHPKKQNAHRPPGRAPAPAQPVFVEGVLQLKGRVGFILSKDPAHEDVLVEGPSLKLAFDGDSVRARLFSGRPRRSGEIVQVLTRARETAVGVYQRVNNVGLLVPERGAEPVRIGDFKGLHANEGDWIVVRITRWPTLELGAAGELIEVIGPREQPKAHLKVLIRKYELADEFPFAAQAEAEAFGDEVPGSALAGRRTYFHVPVFTIDGADAKDFDDALSVERRPEGGYRVGVHIVDVAQYVHPGTALDQEAYRRATSVYFTGAVLPMLPFPLSAGLCSLQPDVVRLTVSCTIDLDDQGRVLSSRVFESAIRSAKRFTYEEVEEVLRGRALPGLAPEISRDVRRLGELARELRKKRFGRGSLDFDFPEPKVVADEEGWPVDIQRRQRLESHRLVEEFMLLANEQVAQYMSQGPFLYRIHDRPDPAKLARLEKTLSAIGVGIPSGFHEGHPRAVQKVLRAAAGRPVEPLVHMMTLRSLKQAVYSPANRGHYGLASACYTHFTSPIRRYPDLCVHRIIKERVHGQFDGRRRQAWEKELPAIALHASQRERVAVEAEREFFDLQKVQFMSRHLGEAFDGIISSVTAFGLFVQLTEYFVEGLVHVTHLADDYYFFDEVRMTLQGRRAHRTFHVGQSVRVKIAAANELKGQLDLELIAVEGKPIGPGGKRPAAPKGRPARPPRTVHG